MEVKYAEQTKRERRKAPAHQERNYALSPLPALSWPRDSRLKAKLFVFLLLVRCRISLLCFEYWLLAPGGVKVCSFSALCLR